MRMSEASRYNYNIVYNLYILLFSRKLDLAYKLNEKSADDKHDFWDDIL